MIKFSNKIVQFGFGAVGKSFYEKVKKEISFNENNYIVISRNKEEFKAYINMGGIADNFYICQINKDNYQTIFASFLKEEDLLIDFADTIGTKDICDWCCKNNIMYINTAESDWADNWYNIFDENILKNKLKKKYLNDPNHNKHPIVLQHGNNPGLVSHFTKLAIEYIIKKQYKNNKELKKLLKENKFNKIAQILNIKMIHVNDIDNQIIKEKYNKEKLINTWCIDAFFFELLSEAAQNISTEELLNDKNNYKRLDKEKGFLEYKTLAIDTKCKTYYPNGYFEGYLVPHEETITIANNLEVKKDNKTIYRPSVMFIYLPCSIAVEYMEKSKTKKVDEFVIRNHIYPKIEEIAYQEKIEKGSEYVGVLLLGENFNPVWVGNRINLSYLYKKKDSYWQTPTITPVAISALAAVCWMIKNKDKKGIYFPDDIDDYKYIITLAEKYISKTIYKTFSKSEIENKLNINLSNINSKDFFVKK